MDNSRSWEQPKTLIDKKTGRGVITEPPHPSFKWKEGHVLRAATKAEAARGLEGRGATIGGDPYEWVRREDVQLD